VQRIGGGGSFYVFQRPWSRLEGSCLVRKGWRRRWTTRRGRGRRWSPTGRPTSDGGWVAAPPPGCWAGVDWFLLRFRLSFFRGELLICSRGFVLQRDQAKAMLSKQAVKIATKAEEHERFIFKVISLLPPPLTIPFLPFLCKSCCHLNKSCRALAFIYRKLRDCCLVSP
jgi:hypothetical protein